MGCRILYDAKNRYAALYCSTSMWAFGPIFYGEDEARRFLAWLGDDPRQAHFTDAVLELKVSEFRMQKSEMEAADGR